MPLASPLLVLFLCGDGMTGQGIDLAHDLCSGRGIYMGTSSGEEIRGNGKRQVLT
ncbi:MAG: hypothetical protein AB7G75_13975 [Candidatus Binatia bacterium]